MQLPLLQAAHQSVQDLCTSYSIRMLQGTSLCLLVVQRAEAARVQLQMLHQAAGSRGTHIQANAAVIAKLEAQMQTAQAEQRVDAVEKRLRDMEARHATQVSEAATQATADAQRAVRPPISTCAMSSEPSMRTLNVSMFG